MLQFDKIYRITFSFYLYLAHAMIQSTAEVRCNTSKYLMKGKKKQNQSVSFSGVQYVVSIRE